MAGNALERHIRTEKNRRTRPSLLRGRESKEDQRSSAGLRGVRVVQSGQHLRLALEACRRLRRGPLKIGNTLIGDIPSESRVCRPRAACWSLELRARRSGRIVARVFAGFANPLLDTHNGHKKVTTLSEAIAQGNIRDIP